MGTILVTGSASGIGRATAERLRKDGQRVIGLDLREAEVIADLGTPAGRAEGVRAIADAARGVLDGVVSAAGAGPYAAPALVLRVNYFGAVAMLDELLPLLARGERPAAVAISSIGGVFEHALVPALIDACLAGDEPAALAALGSLDGSGSYQNAKRALALAVRKRAPAWGARGVRLNAVLPGSIDTPMLHTIHQHGVLGPQTRMLPVPLQREGRPEEIASAIAFLLGPDASYVHGECLHVGGGADAVVRPGAL